MDLVALRNCRLIYDSSDDKIPCFGCRIRSKPRTWGIEIRPYGKSIGKNYGYVYYCRIWCPYVIAGATQIEYARIQ